MSYRSQGTHFVSLNQSSATLTGRRGAETRLVSAPHCPSPPASRWGEPFRQRLPAQGVLPPHGVVDLAGPQVTGAVLGGPGAPVGGHAEPQREVPNQVQAYGQALELVPAAGDHRLSTKCKSLLQ